MAREEIAPRLDDAVAALGTRYTALTIRNQKTRWGSCSSTGAMSFNWRLLLAPEQVLDYVRSEEHTSELQSRQYHVCRLLLGQNSTHADISYAVCGVQQRRP